MLNWGTSGVLPYLRDNIQRVQRAPMTKRPDWADKMACRKIERAVGRVDLTMDELRIAVLVAAALRRVAKREYERGHLAGFDRGRTWNRKGKP